MIKKVNTIPLYNKSHQGKIVQGNPARALRPKMKPELGSLENNSISNSGHTSVSKRPQSSMPYNNITVIP